MELLGYLIFSGCVILVVGVRLNLLSNLISFKKLIFLAFMSLAIVTCTQHQSDSRDVSQPYENHINSL